MQETPATPFPSPPGQPTRQVAIVGLNRETAQLLPSLMDADGIQVIKILNPEHEDLSRLTQFPHLDIIIDTTRNAVTAARLRKLPLKKVDVISGLGARILFCTIRPGNLAEEGGKDRVFQSLEEIREAVGLNKNKDEILKIILNTAIKSTGADCGSLMLLDPSKQQLTIEAAIGLDEKVIVSSIQRVGKGVSGSAIRKGEPILIQGAVDTRSYSADYQKTELISSICCPLMHEGEAVGVLNISSKRPGRVFSAEDVDFLGEFAKLTAEVIMSSKDLEANPPTASAFGILNNVREILAMQYRFEERLNLLLMKIANTFNAKACTYYAFNPENNGFMAIASSSVSVAMLRERQMALEDFFAQRVLKTSSAFCVNATGRTPRTKKWYLLQPIRHGQELAGTLLVYLHSEKNTLKEEMSLIKKIGDLLAREVSKNREMESLKAQSLKYSAISQFSLDIAGAKSLPDLAKMIISNVRLILETETCVLRLRNPRTGNLEVHETLSHKSADWLKDILALDDLITAEMSPGNGTVLIPDLSSSPFNMENLGSESVLAVALESNGEMLGTLSLHDRKSPDPAGGKSFGDQDKEILLNFCLQASKGLKRFLPFPAPVFPESVSARP